MVVGDNSQIVPLEDASPAEEEKILCIVRDMVDTTTTMKHTMNLPSSMLVQVLLNEVAKQFGYFMGTISVHYERQTGTEVEEVCLENCRDQYLGDLVSPGVKRHSFTICEMDGKSPKKMPPPPPPPPSQLNDDDGGSVSLNKSTYFSNNSTVEAKAATQRPSSYTSSDFTYASSVLKSETGYVGLVNQAMTCYLNSLIQTCYMTPEFRNAIYKYHFDDNEGVKNIPYQLQRLFLLLQTSKKRAAETTDLTKSFGWDSSEVWQQHDVQELCRVMFDALEVSWKDTGQANLINHLYQGTMKDYVKCLECGYESAREDTYLDIPLVIRPFGANTAYKSIGEALHAFVTPETLEGRDQYSCEKCNKKCDAHKGLKFKTFPYLLTLQMKRFDFDYNTMQRIKLNHRMSFPEILNLNSLIEGYEGEEGTEDTSLLHGAEIQDTCNDDAVDEGIEVELSNMSVNEDDKNDTCEARVNNKNVQESTAKGPYVYELFSIMIHSGSAAGGHYYAYIKCLSDGQWYSFNDQHVTKITYDDIRKTYGGNNTTRGYYSSTYASSANAYMLMYRQIDKERNVDFITTADLPENVKIELRRLNDKDEADRKQKELDKSTCKIKMFCNHPTLKKKLENKFEIHKDKSFAEATEMAYKMFELDGVVSLDCCRIVKYDEYQDSLECSFEEEDDTLMEKLLGGIKQSYSFDLLLETKRPDQKFQEYKPGGVTVKVYLADMERDMVVEPPSSIRAYLTQTMEEFHTLILQVLNIPDQSMRCVLERFHSDLKLLHNPNKTLKSEGFFKTNKVYLEVNGSASDSELVFERSRFYQLLDRHRNTIRIHINLPSEGEVAEYQKNRYLRENSPSGKDSAVESGVNSAENSVDNGVDMCNHRQGPLPTGAGGSGGAGGSDGTELCRDIDNKMRSLGMQSNLSHSDPALYQKQQRQQSVDLEGQGDCLERQGSRSSLERQDSGSRSTQSTSTSAEFSLNFNVNSVCDETEKSESPDEVLMSASDKGQGVNVSTCDKGNDLENGDLRPPVEGGSGEPVEHSCVDSQQVLPNAALPNTSNELLGDTLSNGREGGIKFTGVDKAGWDEPCSSNNRVCFDSTEDNDSPVEAKRYFCAEPTESDGEYKKSLLVYMDKRITVGEFKSELEPYVDISASHFKVYRVYANNQEFESVKLGETLSFPEDGKINIKLGRALKNGEYRVKVFQLLVNETEPSKCLLETIFARGMTVLESKKLILPELKLEHKMDIPLERCRLRKKTWRNPSTVYMDTQVYEDEIPIYANWEIFLEVLPGPEVMTSTAHLAVFIRRWYPSKYEIGPFVEVVLTDQTIDQLKEQISALSQIDVENIEIAKGRGQFPYDVSLLEIHNDLDWNPSVTSLGMWPLYICDDGSLVYYRDKTEQLLELDDERKKELESKENTRLSKVSARVTYSPRKEKALKIYTDNSTSSSSNSTTTSTTTSNATPDLD